MYTLYSMIKICFDFGQIMQYECAPSSAFPVKYNRSENHTNFACQRKKLTTHSIPIITNVTQKFYLSNIYSGYSRAFISTP